MSMKIDCYIVIVEAKGSYFPQSYYGYATLCKPSPSEVTEKELAILITKAMNDLLLSIIDLKSINVRVVKKTIEVKEKG